MHRRIQWIERLSNVVIGPMSGVMISVSPIRNGIANHKDEKARSMLPKQLDAQAVSIYKVKIGVQPNLIAPNQAKEIGSHAFC